VAPSLGQAGNFSPHPRITEEKEIFFLSKLPQFFKRTNKTTKKGKTNVNWGSII